ncbi:MULTISPECIES: hypothetical protein [Providencia]|uniref:hypothetical protein n=1 Tax=Providencia TaxID=586 RepID=UPI000837CAED|nr:hypothetical protein [Providencia heimbachae]MBP6120845.1 hypothetical protein [Providencia sp.]NIH23304.1 hypothetical protein [Providencia heimbachae]
MKDKMTNQENRPKRVHYFTVQKCKRVFWHPEYGVVRFNEMIANAHEYGFESMYVAGISVKNLPLHYRRFFITESMLSVTGFLCDFWSRTYSNKYVQEITGKPDVLIIDRRLDGCLDVAFFDWLENEDITYQYPTKGDKKFSSTVRYHQSYPHIFIYGEELPDPVDGMREHWPLSLERLNAQSEKQTLLSDNLSPAIRAVIAKLYPTGYRPEWPLNPPLRDDFQVNDACLSVASSNDVVLYSASWFHTKQTDYGFEYGFAVNHVEELESNAPDPSLWQQETLIALRCLESQFDRLAQALAHHFDGNHYSVILNQIKKSKYRALLPLNRAEQDVLFGLVGLNTDDPTGNTVYNLSKTNVADTVSLWEHITNGGDQRQSFEIRPKKGFDDPAYRLFAVIGYCARYYLISHRTSRSCHALDNGDCINYEPGQSLNVRSMDYRKLLNMSLKGELEKMVSILNEYIEY